MIAQSMVKLKGRVAVVNGGCDGIGLSRRGARGVACAVDRPGYRWKGRALGPLRW